MINIEFISIVRVLINDLAVNPQYSDDKLARLVAVAAFQVKNEVEFDTDYAVNVGELTITPDPVTNNGRDDSFINLVCLKAACIFDRGSAIVSAKNALAIREGFSSVDLKGVAAAQLALLRAGGYCEYYDKAKLEYEMGNRTTAGAAIFGPIRTLITGRTYIPYS